MKYLDVILIIASFRIMEILLDALWCGIKEWMEEKKKLRYTPNDNLS